MRTSRRCPECFDCWRCGWHVHVYPFGWCVIVGTRGVYAYHPRFGNFGNWPAR